MNLAPIHSVFSPSRLCANARCTTCPGAVIDLTTVIGAPLNGRGAHHARSGGLRPSFGVASVGVDPKVKLILNRIFASSSQFHSSGHFDTSEGAKLAGWSSDMAIAVIEMELPDACGVICARQLASRCRGLKTILVTTLPDRVLAEKAGAMGIDALCLKPIKYGQVLAILRFIVSKPATSMVPAHPCASEASRAMQGSRQVARTKALSAREEEVLVCLEKGLFYKEIEDQLHVSASTLKKLQHSAYHKLSVHTRWDALRVWSGQRHL